MITVERKVHFARRPNRTVALLVGEQAPAVPAGRLPRVTRLVALAIRLEGLLKRGTFATQQALADALHITQPRLTQLLNLSHLAPDIQEFLLFLAPVERGRDLITERHLRPLAAQPNWGLQRCLWQALLQSRGLVPRT